MPRKPKGLRRHGSGWQTYCRVNTEFRSESWPLDTPVSEMTEWLRQQRAEKSPDTKAARGTFDADAALYLDKVRALPTLKQRIHHIALWIDVFAGRRRRKITSADVRAQRDRWLLEGLAPHTVNLRLRALSNLWRVLDGRRAKNPVREVPEAQERDPEPRSLEYWLAYRLAETIPEQNPLERAQALVMVTTGLTPIELHRSLARHWNGLLKRLYVPGRQKGQGGASRTIPLSVEGNAALALLNTAQGWQRLPSKQFYRCFERARARVARDPLTIDESVRALLRDAEPYVLRHSYATKLYEDSGDAHAAAYILGHRSSQTTARYIANALLARAERAIASLSPEEKLPSSGAVGTKW